MSLASEYAAKQKAAEESPEALTVELNCGDDLTLSVTTNGELEVNSDDFVGYMSVKYSLDIAKWIIKTFSDEKQKAVKKKTRKKRKSKK